MPYLAAVHPLLQRLLSSFTLRSLSLIITLLKHAARIQPNYLQRVAACLLSCIAPVHIAKEHNMPHSGKAP